MKYNDLQTIIGYLEAGQAILTAQDIWPQVPQPETLMRNGTSNRHLGYGAFDVFLPSGDKVEFDAGGAYNHAEHNGATISWSPVRGTPEALREAGIDIQAQLDLFTSMDFDFDEFEVETDEGE